MRQHSTIGLEGQTYPETAQCSALVRVGALSILTVRVKPDQKAHAALSRAVHILVALDVDEDKKDGSNPGAGTEAVHNCIGYTNDRAPGPVLYAYPDETTARENAQDRIIPMLRSSPRLREYLTGMADDMGSLRIKMAHLTIYMAWSGSAARLGNKPIRYLVMDELDKYQSSKREAAAQNAAPRPRQASASQALDLEQLSAMSGTSISMDMQFQVQGLDSATFRQKINECRKDFEAIVRRVVDDMQHQKTRTAYAQ